MLNHIDHPLYPIVFLGKKRKKKGNNVSSQPQTSLFRRLNMRKVLSRTLLKKNTFVLISTYVNALVCEIEGIIVHLPFSSFC